MPLLRIIAICGLAYRQAHFRPVCLTDDSMVLNFSFLFKNVSQMNSKLKMILSTFFCCFCEQQRTLAFKSVTRGAQNYWFLRWELYRARNSNDWKSFVTGNASRISSGEMFKFTKVAWKLGGQLVTIIHSRSSNMGFMDTRNRQIDLIYVCCMFCDRCELCTAI